MRKSLVALVLPVLGLASLAQAYTVNVQVRGTNDTTGDLTPAYVGTAAAPDAGTLWNGFDVGNGYGANAINANGFVATGLRDSMGASTPVSFSITAQLDPSVGPGVPGFYAEPGNAFATIANNLQSGYAFTGMGGPKPEIPARTDDFTIGGLTLGVSYDLYLYGDYASVPSNETTYTINGQSVTITNPASGATAGVFTQGQDYALFQLMPDANGMITGSFTTQNLNDPNAAGFLNGVQITTAPAVPLPPAAWSALAGLVCIGVVRGKKMLLA
jgi:hypothetical protein